MIQEEDSLRVAEIFDKDEISEPDKRYIQRLINGQVNGVSDEPAFIGKLPAPIRGFFRAFRSFIATLVNLYHWVSNSIVYRTMPDAGYAQKEISHRPEKEDIENIDEKLENEIDKDEKEEVATTNGIEEQNTLDQDAEMIDDDDVIVAVPDEELNDTFNEIVNEEPIGTDGNKKTDHVVNGIVEATNPELIHSPTILPVPVDVPGTLIPPKKEGAVSKKILTRLDALDTSRVSKEMDTFQAFVNNIAEPLTNSNITVTERMKDGRKLYDIHLVNNKNNMVDNITIDSSINSFDYSPRTLNEYMVLLSYYKYQSIQHPNTDFAKVSQSQLDSIKQKVTDEIINGGKPAAAIYLNGLYIAFEKSVFPKDTIKISPYVVYADKKNRELGDVTGLKVASALKIKINELDSPEMSALFNEWSHLYRKASLDYYQSIYNANESQLFAYYVNKNVPKELYSEEIKGCRGHKGETVVVACPHKDAPTENIKINTLSGVAKSSINNNEYGDRIQTDELMQSLYASFKFETDRHDYFVTKDNIKSQLAHHQGENNFFVQISNAVCVCDRVSETEYKVNIFSKSFMPGQSDKRMFNDSRVSIKTLLSDAYAEKLADAMFTSFAAQKELRKDAIRYIGFNEKHTDEKESLDLVLKNAEKAIDKEQVVTNDSIEKEQAR